MEHLDPCFLSLRTREQLSKLDSSVGYLNTGRKHQRINIATAQKQSEWIPYLLLVNNHSSGNDYFQEIGPLRCQRKTIWLYKVTEEKIIRVSSMTASRHPRNVLR